MEGVRLEGQEWSTVDPKSALVRFHRLISEGQGVRYREHKQAAWNAGRLAAIGHAPNLDGEEVDPLPERAIYWHSGRGLDINVREGVARVLADYKGYDDLFWPQELHGYTGSTPLAFVARYAQSIGKLRLKHHDQESATLVFPRNTTFSEEVFRGISKEKIPFLRITLDLRPEVRIRRWEIGSEGDEYLLAADVLEWVKGQDGLSYGSRFDFTVNLKTWFSDESTGDSRLVFRVHHEDDRGQLDGQTICDYVLAVGFLDTGVRYLASKRGVDYVIQSVVEDFEAGQESSASLALRGEVLAELVSTHNRSRARIAKSGPTWPELSAQFIEDRVVGKMQQFDLSKKYCSQVGVSVLRRMYGQNARFASMVDKYPADRMSMRQVTDALADFGLSYKVVRGGNPADFVKDAPFTILVGDNPQRAHMAVARRRPDGKFSVWSPPNPLKVLAGDKLRKVSALGVYLVPSEDVPAATFLTRRNAGIAILGLGLIALFWTALRRRRTAGLAQVAGLALICGLPSSCGNVNAADGAAGVRLTEPVEALPLFRVNLGQQREAQLQMRNLTDHVISLKLRSVSCSCVSVMGRDADIEIPAKSVAPVTVRVSGTDLGRRLETVYFVAQSGSKTQSLKVPVRILSGSPIFTNPRSVRISGKSGQSIGTAITLIVACENGDDVSDLTWSSSNLKLTRQDKDSLKEGPLSTTYTLKFDAELPEFSPGPHFVDVTFRNPKPSGAVDVLKSKIALMITN